MLRQGGGKVLSSILLGQASNLLVMRWGKTLAWFFYPQGEGLEALDRIAGLEYYGDKKNMVKSSNNNLINFISSKGVVLLERARFLDEPNQTPLLLSL